MLSDPLPKDVQTLLSSHVDSYERLTVLLLFYREPNRVWSAYELGNSLQIAPQLAETAAANLCAAGLLSRVSTEVLPRYRYAASGEVAASISRLALAYTQNPADVVKFLSANAIERLRASALRAFADAFILKQKDRDSG